MNLLTIVTDEGKIIGAVIDAPHEEMRPHLMDALKSHYDAEHNAEVLSIFIGQPNEMGDVCINVDYKVYDEAENDYAVITLTPAFLFTSAVTAAPPVNGIDYKLLDEQRIHLVNILDNIDTEGDAHISDGDKKALEGIQSLLDHISSTQEDAQLLHYIALVPMGGKYTGKIGQHSTHQKGIYDATTWAKNRFRGDVIVVLAEGVTSFDNDTALTKYLEGAAKARKYALKQINTISNTYGFLNNSEFESDIKNGEYKTEIIYRYTIEPREKSGFVLDVIMKHSDIAYNYATAEKAMQDILDAQGNYKLKFAYMGE